MPAILSKSPTTSWEPESEEQKRLLEVQGKIAPLLQERIARDSIADPYYWLTSGTCTKDEQPKPGLSPYRPFPRLRYLLYLNRFLLDFDIPQGYIYKSRTMMATWSACGAYTHYAATHPAIKVVFQSQDETRALNAVKNCKELWKNSVPRLREKWALAKGLDFQSQDVLKFANGSEIIGIVGDPYKIKSEHPTIYCQDESAIIVDGEQALNEAIATRCPRVTCISSAAPGWYADRCEIAAKPVPYTHNKKMFFIGKLAEPIDGEDKVGNEAIDPSFMMHGMQMKKTPDKLGAFPVIDLDIEADPNWRDPEKLGKLEAMFQPRAHYLREIKRKAYALSGATMYPEFDDAIHVVPHEAVPRRGTLYMSLDPHPRTPHAALWILIDPYSDWWVYREMWPSKIYGQPGQLTDLDDENQFTIKEYTQTIVEHFEGNKIDWFYKETDDEYGIVIEQANGEKIYQRFMDQAGKGFQTHLSETRTEAYSTRYNRYGLYFNDPTKSHEAGEDAIHQLLKVRKHDTRGQWPRLHISDRCPELILELKNARYKQMKRVNSEHDLHQTPIKARLHMVDNLRYLATSGASFEPSYVSNRR